jgi:N-acetylneuraminate lyase
MHLTGLIAAPHTPFHPDGSLNPDVIDRQARHLARSGVRGAFVCGTTGEGMSLTSAERRTVAERWVKAATGRFPVIVHVGHASLAEARELAAHAEAAGADAIASVPPFYHKPTGPAGVVRWLAAIADAAPTRPLYLYDIPAVTGVSVRTAEVVTGAMREVHNFAGVKYSNSDLVGLQECLSAAGERCEVLFGYDELLLAALALGVRGAVGSTYNFAAPLYHDLLAAHRSGDAALARKLQLTSVEMVRALERFGGLAAGKAVMELIGIDCGPVRPPLTPLDAQQKAELADQLTRLRVLEPIPDSAAE